jgi:hypothetical protein
MKKIIYTLLFIAFISSCKNQEIDYPDYNYNAVYFPVQFPVRTLSLGNDLIDNSLDKELTFKIGVCIGGMYENKQDWTVTYKIDNTLASKLKNGTGDTLLVLPEKYIESISPVNIAIIPKGSFTGWITVKLKDAFLDDPIAVTNRYVLPLSIVETSADSVLRGKPTKVNPDKREITNGWEQTAPPMDYTVYGIKFVNKYHGTFLHRGVDSVYDSSTKLGSKTIFRKTYLTENALVKLKTTGRNVVKTNSVGTTVTDDGKTGMFLTFDASNNVKIDPISALTLKPTGTGKFIDAINSNEIWGNQKRDAMYLYYEYNETPTKKHMVYDTLVFRDRAIVKEIQTITVMK